MAIVKPEQLSSGPYSISGSFSGSFQGDGSQLSGIVSSKWSGSNPITRDGNVEITGSLNVTSGITGSLFGTSSWAENAISSSYADFAVSASNSQTASYVENSQTASYVLNAVSSSYAGVANSVNDLNQNVFVSGTLTVLGGATFYGSSSFVYITASQLAVSASFISVNVFEPAQRFGGLIVYDSGSSLATASLAWDSLHNHWVYQNVSGATYTGGMLLSGPRNTGSLGDEPNLTKWFIPRGDGGDHLDDSQIYSSASIHIVTGSLTVTQGITGSLLGTASYATQALSASYAPVAPPFPFTGSALITGSLGVTGSLSTQAQGALSTDIAFRVRNSANDNNFITIAGNGNITVGNSSFVPSNSALRVFSGFGGGNFLNLISDASSFDVYQGIDMRSTGRPGYFALETAGNQGSSITRFRGGGSTSANAKITAFIDHPGDTDLTGHWHFRTQVHLGDAYRTFNTNLGRHTLLIETGSAPTTSSANAFIMYASASTIGNAQPHFRTQNGTIVWLGAESRLFNVTASRTIISSSQNTVSGSSLTVYGSGSALPIFTVQGSQGELFSVTDSLSGSLFSVNDISGLPILEVFSDNTTLIGSYLDPMLITTAKITQTNSGSFTVYSLPTASYDTAFFEYSIKSGSNARAGTIMAIQAGSTVNFTETTTTDIGNTSAVAFTVIVTGSNMALTGSSTSGSWTTKCIIRGV